MTISLTKARATLGLALTILAVGAPSAVAGPVLPPPDDQPDPCAPFGIQIPGCNT